MDITSDFQAYHDRVTKSLVEVVRTGGQISNADLGFHRSSGEVSRSLDQQNARLLRLTNKLLKAASQDSSVKPPTLRDQDGIDDNWRGIVEVVDDLLEKADASLDEFTGVIRRLSPALPDGAQTPSKQQSQPTRPSTRIHFPKVLQKPQLLFHRKINNLDPQPFKPLLVDKPHAIKTLEDSIGDGPEQYGHPYAEEILQFKYPERVNESAPPIPYTPPEASSAVFVDTEQGIQDMLQELMTVEEIAVDLEHHEYRSYYGIVSLMQISTRNKDWIVDTLKPWREKLQILNQVFTDPNILKVFHGSSMDMIWLQRDLGLYVVGLFDTYYACEALNFPGRGLKYLLQRFANFEAQKQYQMADWRIRPLPAELIDYARSDTHYLLYIYDHLRNMLIEQSTPQADLIDHVLQGSKKEAAQTYVRFVYNRESGRGSHGWFNLFTERWNHFNNEQFAVFRALHAWRDIKAREQDESCGFVLPNRALWALAENIPTNQTELYRIGLRPVPSIVAQQSREFFDIVHNAKREAASDPPVHEMIRLNQEKYGVQQNRWRKPREEQLKTQHTGLGAILQHLNQNGEFGSGTSTPATTSNDEKSAEPVVNRARQSSLWGNITTAMSGISIEPSVAARALQSVLPLPKLSGKSFADTNGIPSPVFAQGPPAMLETPPSEKVPTSATKREVLQQVNDVFTLKQQSRKRKADDIEDEDEDEDENETEDVEVYSTAPGCPRASTNGDISPTSPETPTQRNPEHEAKRLAKQKRKAEKRARKAAREAEVAEKAQNAVPFDYASTANLIGSSTRSSPVAQQAASKAKGKSNVNRDGKGQPMNPFAKALDTGTGAKRGRMGKELAGKSMTFQS